MSNMASNKFWCVSLNPAIDKRMRMAQLIPGKVNRVRDGQAHPGGKAAHVAMSLRALGAKPLWLGFAGGSTGDELLRGLEDLGIQTQAVRVDQNTRVNLEIIADDGCVTEILDPGAPVAEKYWKVFSETFATLLSQEKRSGIVLASGSLPRGTATNAYAEIIEVAHRCGHKIFLDTSGEPMRLALSAGPDFVKPNREEAEWLIGEEIRDCRSAKAAVHRLIGLGARSAAVSLGHEGLVWRPAADQHFYHAQPPSISIKSSVGSGDAALAGFAYAAARQFDVEKTLRLATACGAANCLADAPGQLQETDVRAFEPQVRIETLM
jgi:1-phosphofructokinase family hexose kinase